MRSEATKCPGYLSFRARNLSAIEDDEPNKMFCLIRRIELEEEDSKEKGRNKEEQKKRMLEIESSINQGPYCRANKETAIQKSL